MHGRTDGPVNPWEAGSTPGTDAGAARAWAGEGEGTAGLGGGEGGGAMLGPSEGRAWGERSSSLCLKPVSEACGPSSGRGPGPRGMLSSPPSSLRSFPVARLSGAGRGRATWIFPALPTGRLVLVPFWGRGGG